jgi:hypothetical protein
MATGVGADAQPSSPPFDTPYVDLDAYLDGPVRHLAVAEQRWGLVLLPNRLIYPSYLAAPKESRFSAHVINERDDGWLWDATLGSRVGVLRYGTLDGPEQPQGIQIDAEGSSQVRLDLPEELDVRSADFRAGGALTIGTEHRQTKLAYYHLSSHVGDEFLLKNPSFSRLNYVRDALVLGHCLFVTRKLRVYGEAGWAFHSEVSEPWEFQVGADYAPVDATGLWGAPFLAVHAGFREEQDFDGGLTVQAGWAWRGADAAQLLRLGAHYYNGPSTQLSFFDGHEQQIGFGVWYDFF